MTLGNISLEQNYSFEKHLRKVRGKIFQAQMGSIFDWVTEVSKQNFELKIALLQYSVAKANDWFNKLKQEQARIILLIYPLYSCPPIILPMSTVFSPHLSSDLSCYTTLSTALSSSPYLDPLPYFKNYPKIQNASCL